MLTEQKQLKKLQQTIFFNSSQSCVLVHHCIGLVIQKIFTILNQHHYTWEESGREGGGVISFAHQVQIETNRSSFLLLYLTQQKFLLFLFFLLLETLDKPPSTNPSLCSHQQLSPWQCIFFQPPWNFYIYFVYSYHHSFP